MRTELRPFLVMEEGWAEALSFSVLLLFRQCSWCYPYSSRMVNARDFDGARLIRWAGGKPAQRLAR
jgi:hypothetical protein